MNPPSSYSDHIYYTAEAQKVLVQLEFVSLKLECQFHPLQIHKCKKVAQPLTQKCFTCKMKKMLPTMQDRGKD